MSFQCDECSLNRGLCEVLHLLCLRTFSLPCSHLWSVAPERGEGVWVHLCILKPVCGCLWASACYWVRGWCWELLQNWIVDNYVSDILCELYPSQQICCEYFLRRSSNTVFKWLTVDQMYLFINGSFQRDRHSIHWETWNSCLIQVT